MERETPRVAALPATTRETDPIRERNRKGTATMAIEAIRTTKILVYANYKEIYGLGGSAGQAPLQETATITLTQPGVSIEAGCTEPRAVTLSICGFDRIEAYGYDLSLYPEAARQLANELVVAAHAADAGTQAEGDDDD